MNKLVLVQIVGAPIACEEGMRDSWREVSAWAAGQLKTYFGETVQVEYYDLFDADCPSVPAGSQLPLVLVENEAVISGGKISIPIIRSKINAILEVGHQLGI
jgi:hypothetical protein